MPKDNREIKRGVRLGPKSFLPGQEDELAATASSEHLGILLASGAIEGNWTATESLAPKALEGTVDAEMVAGYISATFGIERSSDETASEFLESIVQDLRSAQTKQDELEADAQAKTRRITELSDVNRGLEGQLAGAKSELTKAKAEATRVKTENERLAKELAEAKKQIASATSQG